jgi:Tol biopolymer transport system component
MGSRVVGAAIAALVALSLVSANAGATAGGGAVLFAASSPEGSACGPLMLVDTDGSAQSMLGRDTCFGVAAYSPDGTKLAYYDASAGELAVVDSDGANRVLIAPDLPVALSWAGNGALVWESLGTDPEVKSARSDGSDVQVVCGGTKKDFCVDPSANPAGTRVAVVFDGQIWTFDLDGGNGVQLTSGKLFGTIDPAWSRDGARISFLSFEASPSATGLDLSVMNQDGTNRQVIATGCECLSPTWSHDGTFIVYGDQDSTTGYGGISFVRTQTDGSGSRTLTGDADGADILLPGGPNGIVLSPDDRTIYFTREVDSDSCCDVNVYAASAVDGSGLTQLTNDGSALDLVLGYSPVSAENAGTPPPPAPNLTLGSMKLGGGKLTGGEVLQVGLDFSIKGKHPEATLSFTGVSARLDVICNKVFKVGSIVVPLTDASYDDPAKSTAWYPTGDASDPSGYQGQAVIPDTMCGAGQSLSLFPSGTLSATVASDWHLAQPVSVRWHVRAGDGAGKWSKAGSITLP